MKKKQTFLLTFALAVCLLFTTGVMAAFAADEENNDGLDASIAPLEITSLTYAGNWNGHTLTGYFTTDITMPDYSDSFFTNYVEYKNAAGELQSDKRNTTMRRDMFFGFVYETTDVKPTKGDTITIKKGLTIEGTNITAGQPDKRQLKEDVTFTCLQADTSVVWIKGEITTLALGDMTMPDNAWLEIPLTDSTQTIVGGGVGDSVQFGVVDVDWGYNYINDKNLITLQNGGTVYKLSYLRNFGNGPTTKIRLAFSPTGEKGSPTLPTSAMKKGAIVSFSPECVITAGNAYNFGANGLHYYFDGSAWNKVQIATKESQVHLTNAAADFADVHVDGTVQLDYAFETGYGAPAPAYKTSDEKIATVSASGLVKGVAAGDVTVMLDFGDFELTQQINIKPALMADKLKVEITSPIFNDDGALVAYVGEDLDKAELVKILQAKFGYNNGSFGEASAVTAEEISFDGYDNGKAGTSAIKVTRGDCIGTLPVHVYPINTFTGPTAANVAFWGNIPHLNVTSLTPNSDYYMVELESDDVEALGIDEYVTFTSAEKNGKVKYTFGSVKYHVQAQIMLGFTDKNSGNMEVGDVLTLKKGFRMYKREEGGTAYIATYELAENVSYVWDGTYWQGYKAEATSIELTDQTRTMALDTQYVVPYIVKPDGAYIKPIISSSDPSKVKVSDDGTAIIAVGVTEEDAPVTITVRLGDDTATAKIFTVTVVRSEVVGFEVYGDREINIARGTDFGFTYYFGEEKTARNIQAVAVYANGDKGVPFDLNKDNTIVGDLDKDKVGIQNIKLTITHDEKTFDAITAVNVRNVAALVSNAVVEDLHNAGVTNLYLGFSQSVTNEINNHLDVYVNEMAGFIKFVRDGKEYDTTCWIGGTYLGIEPVFPKDAAAADKVFKKGDKIVLKTGMPFYRWTGHANNYVPIGAGEYIVAGKIEHEAVYECGGAKSWNTYIDYVDFTFANETIELGFGKLGDVGATMVPSYATIGEFTIVSSDTSIVSVNANGLIKGEKLGEAELTVTLSDERLDPIVKKIKVKVVDVKSGIKFSESKIYVPTGTVTVTGQTLKDAGLTGVYVWASGKEEGEVDFANAKIQGFSANAEGEQEITVRITENGNTVSAKLTVVIGEKPEEGCGCGSAVNSTSNIATMIILATVMLVAAASILVVHKAKKNNG